jgi:hypothetical protein
MMADILVREEFREWLKSKKRAVVGTTRMANNCPLTRYLRYAKGKKQAAVGRFKFTLGRVERLLPKWAVNFTLVIDQSETYSGTPITANRALRILDSVV